MKSGSIILAILSLPAAATGYFVTSAILMALSLPPGLAAPLLLFVPLLVAGLCMVPFIAPALNEMGQT